MLPSFVEPLLEQHQHADELAEDEDAMAAVDDFLQKFAEQVQLAGSIGGIDALEFQQVAGRQQTWRRRRSAVSTSIRLFASPCAPTASRISLRLASMTC